MPFTLHGIPGFIRSSIFVQPEIPLAVLKDESLAPEFLPSLEVNVFGKYSVKYLFFSCIYRLEHVPTKLHDFVEKDMLQHIELARFLFGEVESLRREAR